MEPAGEFREDHISRDENDSHSVIAELKDICDSIDFDHGRVGPAGGDGHFFG